MLLVIMSVVTLGLLILGIIGIRGRPDLGTRGWRLSGLGVLAGVLYAAIAIYPWGGYDSLLVLPALPIGFAVQTIGAIMCLKAIVITPERSRLRDRLVLAGDLVVLLGVLGASVALGDGFYLLAALSGACLLMIVMFYVYYDILRAEQRV